MHLPVPYVYEHTVKFGETDAAAMVYTPRFADYCMEAAEVWFREYLDFDWYEINTSRGMGTPVVHMEMDFKLALKGADVIGVEVLVAHLGVKSITLLFSGRKLNEDGSVGESFSGRFVYCITSQSAGGAIAIPDAQVARIKAYMNRCPGHERGDTQIRV